MQALSRSWTTVPSGCGARLEDLLSRPEPGTQVEKARNALPCWADLKPMIAAPNAQPIQCGRPGVAELGLCDVHYAEILG